MPRNCNTTPNNNNDKTVTSTSTSTSTDENASSQRKRITKPFITSLMVFGRKISLYIKPEEYEDYLLFKELAKMERVTLSHLAEIALIEYARRHHPGNPQIPLTRFSGEPKVKAKCHCGRQATHEVWAKNNWHGFLCMKDFTRQRQAGNLERSKVL